MTRRAAVFLAAALAAWAQTGVPVQGRVTSSLDGEPVVSALVTLRELPASGSGQPQIYVCQTGADGRFSIAAVAPGVYGIQPSKRGYETRPPNRFATAHDSPPVILAAGKPLTELELRLIPDSEIAGKVLDADGDPLRHAMVEVQQYTYVAGEKQLQTHRQVQTDDRGEYRVFYLAPGRYLVRAESSPRSPLRNIQFNQKVRGTLPPSTLAAAYYPGVADPARATELEAPPGVELDGIDLTLGPEKRYSIRGKFSGGDSAVPRRAVRVVERTEAQLRPQYSMTMPGRDSYEVQDIGPGSYMVIGTAINPAHPEEREYARQQVDVVDRDVDGLDLVFSPGVSIKGMVKSEGAAPLPLENLMMFLRAIDLSGQQQAKVAADGTFATAEMAPGIYQVILPNRNAYLKSVRIGDQEAAGGKIDTEHLAAAVTVVVSADFGRVEGTVTDETGKPVYNADVTLIPDQSLADWHERFQNAVTSIAGKFTLMNIQPGEYKVFAWLGVERGAPQNADFRQPYEARGLAIKVEANGRQSLDLKPIAPAPER